MENKSMLPELCYSKCLTTGKTIAIKKGELGYFKLDEKFKDTNPDVLNEKLGLTKYQVQAMENGSMFGWDVPGANPVFLEKMFGGVK